jgi:hypothetical protein
MEYAASGYRCGKQSEAVSGKNMVCPMIAKRETEASELRIFEKILSQDKGALSPDLARYLLTLGFDEADKARMHDLAVRNQSAALSTEEREELIGYSKAGCLLGILHSKARQSLKRPNRKKASAASKK